MTKIRFTLEDSGRVCNCCKQHKSYSEFYRQNKPGDGVVKRRSICKKCCLIQSKKDYRRTYSDPLKRELKNKKHREYIRANKKHSRRLRMLNSAKNRAKKKGLDFDLTIDDIIIPERCPILGIDLDPECVNPNKFKDNSPSLDRINNLKGYIKENVIVVSLKANVIKRDYLLKDLDLLLEDTKKIVEFYKEFI